MSEEGLWRLPVAGGDAKLVLPEAGMYLYALAGRSIYYGHRDRKSIWVLRTDSGRKFEYVRFSNGTISLDRGTVLTVSGDERTIMYSQTEPQESDLMLVENFR